MVLKIKVERNWWTKVVPNSLKAILDTSDNGTVRNWSSRKTWFECICSPDRWATLSHFTLLCISIEPTWLESVTSRKLFDFAFRRKRPLERQTLSNWIDTHVFHWGLTKRVHDDLLFRYYFHVKCMCLFLLIST